MTCPACGNPIPDEMSICPYCQTPVPEYLQEVFSPDDMNYEEDYDAYYCADTLRLRKNYFWVFWIGLLLVAILIALSVFLQLRDPSLQTQIRRADAAELADICSEYPSETAEDQYTDTLLQAVSDLQQTYALHNDQETEVLNNLKKMAATQNVMVREQASDATAEMESNRLLQEINRIRTQRQRRMLTENDDLTETAQLLADTYQEEPDTDETETARLIKENVSESPESVYQILLVNCNSYEDAVSQYNEEKQEVSVNFLTTQDYTKIGISSIYDSDTEQFSFILLLLP